MSKILYCNNCGKSGHISNDCKMPITSVGIILVNYENKIPQYLLVRRKDTFGYSDLIRGKYPMYNNIFIENLVSEMTLNEKYEILKVLDEIEVEGKDPNDTILKRFYMYLKSDEMAVTDGINLRQIIENSITTWKEPEWGFPKGRRNYQERDLDCALREFEEETGYNRNEITLIENLIPLEEIFTGSNYKIYKHRYYLAKLIRNDNIKLDTFQESEISKMEWCDINKCLEYIRPYNKEKLEVLDTVDELLKNSLFYSYI